MKITSTYLRWIGLLEGTSYLLLLFVAMPLKYLFAKPFAVQVLGSAHGGLFVVYVLAAMLASRQLRWPLRRLATVLVAAVLPFGPFVIDRSLSAWLRGPAGTA